MELESLLKIVASAGKCGEEKEAESINCITSEPLLQNLRSMYLHITTCSCWEVWGEHDTLC